MEVALVTGRWMPRPDGEMPLLVSALEARGVRGHVVAWCDPFDWSCVPLVLVRSTWDYVGHLDAFLNWAEGVDGVTMLVNPMPVLAWNSHKSYLTTLAGRGVPGLVSCHTHLSIVFPMSSTDPTENPAATVLRAAKRGLTRWGPALPR